MKIVVAIKQIPSTSDELELNSDGSNLDFDELDFVLNEFDEQAVEQGVLIKEAGEGTVSVIGLDLIEELDGALHTALAKGADSVTKIVGDFDGGMSSHLHSRLLANAIKTMSPDVVLTGVQAADDLDGQIGPMLAAYLDMPYVGVVANVEAASGGLKVTKEYSGGLMAEFEVSGPVVIGVQAASSPPRYAPVSKIRQMAQNSTIEEIEADNADDDSGLTISKMAKPISTGHAEMLEGDAEGVAAKIIEIIKERGLL
ncbi:MAG: electron transfer flavoprotein subunit beta/FixA family protein [Chloroflexota bacterium]